MDGMGWSSEVRSLLRAPSVLIRGTKVKFALSRCLFVHFGVPFLA